MLSNWDSLVAQSVKNLSMMRETRVRSLGWEDPLEKEMAIHSSTIAWKIPWTGDPGRLQSMGSQRVGHDRTTELNYFIPLEGNFKMFCRSALLSISHSFVSDSLQPHGLQHARLPCPSSISGATQTHVHRVGDAIQPSHPLSSPSPALDLSQHLGLFQ